MAEENGEATGQKMAGVKLVLLDIEGTVCPISYVKDTLFPYATKALPAVLAAKWDDPSFTPYRDAAPEQARTSPEAYRAAVDELTAANSKIAWLKNLQGYLWEDGYKSGAYSTPLFEDVAPRLKAWRKDGHVLAIYSSGSVFAQKLLFAHVQKPVESNADETPALTNRKRGRTDGGDDEAEDLADENEAPSKKPQALPLDDSAGDESTADKIDDVVDGDAAETKAAAATTPKGSETEDLTGLFQGWFDTTNAGPKTEAKSYEVIAKELKLEPQEILFFSDNVLEIEAAVKSKMKAVLVDRPGNAPVDESDAKKHRMVKSLEEIVLK